MRVFLVACLLVAGTGLFAQVSRVLPSETYPVLPLESLTPLQLPEMNAALRLSQERNRTTPGPLRIAEPIELGERARDLGDWEMLADGNWLWRLRIDSPGATDLNFGFTEFDLPEGCRLFIYSENHDFRLGPFTGKDASQDGAFWTPMVPGDRAVLEMIVPNEAMEKLNLVVGRIAQGFHDFLHFQPRNKRQGSCNIDVVCPEGDDWRDQIRAVGAYTVGGVDTCTGTLIMDADSTFRPFFITANHCGLNSSNDASVVVYWNFESPNCGDLSGGVRDQFTSGSTFRASASAVDMALIELDSHPDPAYNVFYAGWDRTNNVPNGSVGIHHPNVDEKAISFNDDPLTTDNSCIGSATPDTHWWVDDWEQGTTEPGSSGSALFDPANGLLVGFLSGGQASCTNLDYDCYGKFAVAWDGGNSPASRLMDWLDPSQTGAMTVQGSNPAAVVTLSGFTSVDLCGEARLGGNGVWEPGETIQLTISASANEAVTGVTGTITTDTPGVIIQNAALTFPNIMSSGEIVVAQQVVVVDLDPSLTCFEDVEFEVTLQAAGVDPNTSSFSQVIGSEFGLELPISIPDNSSIEIPFQIDEDHTITDLDLRVGINHTYVGDLQISLRGPDQTEVLLLDRPGDSPGQGNCGDENMDVRFDDDSAVDLSTHCPGTDPWYSGEAAPVEALAAFNGKSTLGTWTLIITDNAGQDVGTLVQFEFNSTPSLAGVCEVCDQNVQNIDVSLSEPFVVCSGQEFTINMEHEGGVGPYTYDWTPAQSINDPSVQEPVATITEPTLFQVTVTGTGSMGTGSVMVYPAPSAAQLMAAWHVEGVYDLGWDMDGNQAVDLLDLVMEMNLDCNEAR